MKITSDDMKRLRATMAHEWPDLRVTDVAFAVLCETFEDDAVAVAVAYREKAPANGEESKAFSPRAQALRKAVHQIVFGAVGQEDTISKEENRSELIRMIDEIQAGMDNGEIEKKDGLKMIADIRVKLNDKFEIEERSEGRQRLIIVPQKRDMICRYTNRECMNWPTREACIRHYNIKEA